MNETNSEAPVSSTVLVRPVCGIQSENGAALLLDTVCSQIGQSPTARQMKVREIVLDLVACPKCFDLFLSAHIARLKECLKKAHDQWKSDGEPDLGECRVEQDIDGRDYLMFAYLKVAERYRPNDEGERPALEETNNTQPKSK